MFLAMVALASLVLGLLLRRPLGHVAERRFRLLPLLYAGLLLHFVPIPSALSGFVASRPIEGMPMMGGMIYILSLAFILIFAWSNRRVSGMSLIMAGLLMNLAVIASNGGQMPVDPQQLAAKGGLEHALEIESSGQWSTWRVMDDQTNLAFFGDLFTVPRPVVGPVILSLGDFVLAAGIAVFILIIPEAGSQKPRAGAARTAARSESGS